MQRKLERSIRAQKRRVLAAEASGDKEGLTNAQTRLQVLRQSYSRFSKAAGLRTEDERLYTAGFGRKEAARARAGADQGHKQKLKEIGAKNSSLNTLAKYIDAGYNTSPEYVLLEQYTRDVEAGWISPLSGFENYKNLYYRIQNEVVGRNAANGTLITGQVPHFMQRVIGTMVDPEKLKQDLQIIRRSGVEVDDIKDALFSPERINPVLVRKSGQRSVKLLGKNCAVTINPDTGMLIQTNPRKRSL